LAQSATGIQTTRIVFLGSPDFAVPSLERLIEAGYDLAGVYTQPDRPSGRGRHLAPSPVKRLAQAHGLPVFQPASLRTPEALDELTALRPDVMVVVAFGQILRPAVLALAAHGVLNVHPSLLPRYRGASPIPSTLLNGDAETAVTVMLLDEGMDTGPILAQRTEAILPEDDAGSLADRLALLGAELLVQTLPRWLAGEIEPQAQDDALASVTGRIDKNDGALDWALPARELWGRVRAYTPWPGAMTTLDGTPVQILKAWPLDGAAPGAPGEIVPVPAGASVPSALGSPAFAVATGSGLLLPLLVQRAGRRALPARDFANGERGLIGRRFGA
jgi:methionyl-tRNA formyltransferase